MRVAGFVSVTLTPGIRASLGSWTTPVMDPIAWPNALHEKVRSPQSNASDILNFIFPPRAERECIPLIAEARQETQFRSNSQRFVDSLSLTSVKAGGNLSVWCRRSCELQSLGKLIVRGKPRVKGFLHAGR